MKNKKTYTVESTPENVQWGVFDPNKEPVVKVSSGATVKIETVTPPRDSHLDALTSGGIDEADVLDDEVTISEEVTQSGPGPHVVTGPIAIEDAEPGDVLEVQITDIELRAPYGINLFMPNGGELSEEFPYEEVEIVPFDLEKGVAEFGRDIEIPLDPFLGIMAVSPSPSEGKTDTAPPDYFGGNLDLKHLGAGATLYLPVHAEGALFWGGDGHGIQGNGEVCLTAAETSLTATFRFILHKDTGRLNWPLAETEDHYIVVGLHESLDNSLHQALKQCISFLHNQKGLSKADAYRLASLAVDFNITQVVNGNKGVHGLIPKNIFDDDGELDFSEEYADIQL